MDWKKNNTLLFIALAVIFSLGMKGEAYARGKVSQDAMWSVDNAEKKQIVPSYTGGESPFPIEIKNTAELKVRRSAEKRAQRKKVVVKRRAGVTKADNSREIGEILKKIHKAVAEKQAYNADVEAIRVDGRIDSTFGAKVLIHNRWFSTGDNVLVSIMQTDELTNLIAELASIDANLAEIVASDLKTKIEESDSATLTVTKIGKDFIELQDNFGEKHIVTFVSNSL
jgi:hypothetical protein